MNIVCKKNRNKYAVEKYLNKIAKTEGPVHLALIDPENQSPQKAGNMALKAMKGGTSAILVGGSTDDGSCLDETIKAIKGTASLPIILFPANKKGISPHADAIFFLSVLNSRNIHFLINNLIDEAPLVEKYGIEPLPMGYIIVEPGGTAARVGEANLIPREKSSLAAEYALAAKYIGMRYIYLEAGSGADRPIPVEMVAGVKKAVGESVKIIVGGGIRDGKTAQERVKAGADIIVTGTVIEQADNIEYKIREIVEAMKDTK